MPELEISRRPLTDAALLVDSVQDYAIFMLDATGVIASWSPGASTIKGYTAEEAIGQHFSMFYPEADRRAGKPERVLEIARSEGRFEEEGWRVRKDGSRFFAHVVINAIWSTDGELAGFAKITHDITERRRAEEALYQSEERFRLLVDSVRDYAIFMLSTEGRIISWNPGAERIKGYAAEEVLGRHFSIFYPPVDIENGKPELELETAIAEGRYEEEGWRLRKDGSRFWANVILTPIRDRQGHLRGFAKVTRDMTERRKAREELLVTQQQARELALDNAAKDEFLGIVAHELRTPISVFYGSAQFLRTHFRGLSERDREELISNLAEESESMWQLVENLLALSRPQSPETVRLEDLSVEQAITASVSAFNRRSPLRRVQVMGSLKDTDIRVEPTYFDRVLQNLLENADKYSDPAEAIEVVVTTSSETVSVEVMDRGSGVESSEIPLIFESFYRSPATAQGTPGKGLGLTVCRRLLELMGGSIDARARVGGGLVVRIFLRRGTGPSAD